MHHYIDQCQRQSAFPRSRRYHLTLSIALSPDERGQLLEKSDIFAAIHLEAAQQGQTVAPAAEANVDLHFTSFVPAPDPNEKGKSRLIELDGVRGGPIDCGPCNDFLSVYYPCLSKRHLVNSSLYRTLHYTSKRSTSERVLTYSSAW